MCLWLHVSLRDVDKLVSTELDAAEISEIQCLFPAAMARTQCNVEISPKHATFSDRSFTSSTKRIRFCFFSFPFFFSVSGMYGSFRMWIVDKRVEWQVKL